MNAALLLVLTSTACFAPRRLPEENTDTQDDETAATTSLGSSGPSGSDSATTGSSATESSGASGVTSETETSGGPTASTGGPATSSSTDITPDDTGSGSAECGGAACLEVPDGWNGPVLVQGGAVGVTSACVGDEAFLASVGLGAEGASCDCSCDDPGINCDGQLTRLHRASSGACAGSIASEDLNNNACTDTAYYDDAWMWFTVVDPSLAGESCAPSSTETVPPLTWEAEVRACEPAEQPAQCGSSGTCLDFDSGDGEVCVWRPGDYECPDESFTRGIAYEGASDDRGCSACTCGNVTGTCTGEITYHSDESSCVLGPQGPVAELDCFYLETPARSVEVQVESAHSCGPIGGDPVGGATPSGPVTYCCI